MKKVISFALLATFLAVSNIGCGGDAKKDKKAPETPKREVPKDNPKG